MKAHINGITVEGTPQEIVEYKQLQQSHGKPFKQGIWGIGDSLKVIEQQVHLDRKPNTGMMPNDLGRMVEVQTTTSVELINY